MTEILDLITQAQRGNAQAFGKIYDLYADRLFRYVKIKVQNQQQAEDILQDTFIKAWQGLANFKIQNGNFNAWIYKIASNCVTDYFRRMYRKPESLELEEHLNLESKADSVSELAKREDMEMVKQAMLKLPSRYRQVLELRFIQDFSIKETAEILDSSSLAVRLVQHRALKQLRQVIDKQHELGYQRI